MNLDHDFFHMSKLIEDQKKGLHQKRNTFIPRIQMKTCAQMQTRVKLLGRYIPESPAGFGTPGFAVELLL